MKLAKVRLGERFVFDHVGGVWTKATVDKARCIYGKNFGREEIILPDVPVYVIFEDRNRLKRKMEPAFRSQEGVDAPDMTQNAPSCPVEAPMPTPQPEPASEPVAMPEPKVGGCMCQTAHLSKPIGTMKMVLVDEDEKVILEIPNASAAQIAAYSDAVGIRLQDRHNGRNVLETYVDHLSQTFYVVLGDEA